MIGLFKRKHGQWGKWIQTVNNFLNIYVFVKLLIQFLQSLISYLPEIAGQHEKIFKRLGRAKLSRQLSFFSAVNSRQQISLLSLYEATVSHVFCRTFLLLCNELIWSGGIRIKQVSTFEWLPSLNFRFDFQYIKFVGCLK